MRQTFAGNYGNVRWTNTPKPKKTGATCAVCQGPIYIDTRRYTGEEEGFEYCKGCGNAVRMPDGSVPPPAMISLDDLPF